MISKYRCSQCAKLLTKENAAAGKVYIQTYYPLGDIEIHPRFPICWVCLRDIWSGFTTVLKKVYKE